MRAVRVSTLYHGALTLDEVARLGGPATFKRGVFSSPGGNELDAKLMLPQLVQMNGLVYKFQGLNPNFQEVILMFMNFLGPGLQSNIWVIVK